jgi:threonine dehydratase
LRGALNKLMNMSPERRAAGVITASAGNHGLGVAYAAAEFQVEATVYVPLAANQLKVEAIKRLGARVVAAGDTYKRRLRRRLGRAAADRRHLRSRLQRPRRGRRPGHSRRRDAGAAAGL